MAWTCSTQVRESLSGISRGDSLNHRARKTVRPAPATGRLRSDATVHRVAQADPSVVAFDRVRVGPHPTSVGSPLRCAASIVCLLAFAQTAVAQCAGWQPTPQARRQCCQGGACPMHHEDGASRMQITQAAADDCCAQSPQRESNPSSTAFAATITLAVFQSLPPVVLTLAPVALVSVPWETPSPPARVPKHLLLSVLLV